MWIANLTPLPKTPRVPLGTRGSFEPQLAVLLAIAQIQDAPDAPFSMDRLVEILGRSRTAVRETIAGLSALGVLDVRHGVGTFVSDSISVNPLLSLLEFRLRMAVAEGTSLRWQLLGCIKGLELGMLPAVATKLTPRVLNELQGRNPRDTGDGYVTSIAAFHGALFSPAGEGLGLQLVEGLWRLFAETCQPGEKQCTSGSEAVSDCHSRLITALRSPHGDGARHALVEVFALYHSMCASSE